MNVYRRDLRITIQQDDYYLLIRDSGFIDGGNAVGCFEPKQFYKELHSKYHWLVDLKKIKERKGLLNIKNSCYMNAILQCLCGLSSVVNYILSKNHYTQCLSKNKNCIYCMLHAFIFKMFYDTGNKAFKPKDLYNYLCYW